MELNIDENINDNFSGENYIADESDITNDDVIHMDDDLKKSHENNYVASVETKNDILDHVKFALTVESGHVSLSFKT